MALILRFHFTDEALRRGRLALGAWTLVLLIAGLNTTVAQDTPAPRDLSAPAAPVTGQAGGPTLPSTADPGPADEGGGKGDAAYGAYQRGRFVTAFREAMARIESDPNDAAAMTLIGDLHAQGAGAPRDPARALDWYRLAAERSDVNAMFRLGLAFVRGEGTRADPARGRTWLEKAAGGGQVLAAYNLALIRLGDGEPADMREARRLLEQAAKADLAEAQYALGVMLREGRAGPAEKPTAAEWFRRAAAQGDIPAIVELAILTFNGDGVTKDEVAAFRLFRRAAFRGNAIAQNRLARLYAAGRGTDRDPIEAAAWHLTAAGQGLADAWLDAVLGGLTPQERARAQALALQRLPV